MNYRLFRVINNWSGHHALDSFMRLAAKDLIFLAFAGLLVLAVLAWRRRGVLALVGPVLTLGLAFALGLGAAAVHAEMRPFQRHHVHLLIAHAGGQSFPSDHATAAFACAMAALVFLSRAWGCVLLAAALLIGVARVYAGLHYPGDILGSFLVASVAAAVAALIERARTRSAAPQPVSTA
jgi:undecaprenyl-diphosphatase